MQLNKISSHIADGDTFCYFVSAILVAGLHNALTTNSNEPAAAVKKKTATEHLRCHSSPCDTSMIVTFVLCPSALVPVLSRRPLP